MKSYMSKRRYNIALTILQGNFDFKVIRLFVKLLLTISTPVRYILHKLFCENMLNIYAILTTMFFIQGHLNSFLTIFRKFDKRHRTLLALRKKVTDAQSSHDWKKSAMEYEILNKEILYKTRSVNTVYDKTLLQQKLAQLIKNRNNNNIRDFMNELRLDLTRNIGNIAKKRLHEHFMFIPNTISKYNNEVKDQLNKIANSEDINLNDKIKFFRETRHSFGRTALLLSGGASLGTFHMGVAKALFDNNLLPQIIAGSSVGSIVAAIISVRTNEELIETFHHLDEMDLSFFNDHKTINLIKNFLEKGYLYDDETLIQKLRIVLGEYTFKEAYERTGRILNVSVTPAETNEPSKVLNYLTAPNVMIWSAVAASSAFPGLFPSQNIYTKKDIGKIEVISTHEIIDSYGRKWQDGSLNMDLPVNTVTEMFNCNYFIVSQCNPHIIPLLCIKRSLNTNTGRILEAEFKHRCKQIQWILPKCIPKKWIKLFTQTWEGDVTMILPMTSFDPSKLISNPKLEEILDSVKIGEKKTWENLWAVECNCAIEMHLESIYNKLLLDVAT